MIQARELRKSFGEIIAVDGVSFELQPGESFGLLGPNGAGKTTTLSILTGVLRPDAGEVVLEGRPLSGDPNARRALGIAPQSIALYDELTAAENLTFFARLYGLAGAELKDRVRWALDFAELTDRGGDRVKTFSGGMQRRLNMAAALVHNPSVIVFDEPTVGVDPQSRNHIFDRIESLRAEGRTMIYTTHYMEEAQRLCDRVAIMDRGRILDVGTVDDLIDRHGGSSVVAAELTKLPDDPGLLPAPLDGLHLRFESDTPLEDVGRLASSGVAFQTLEIGRPDLEAVFLSLTGRSLRD